jgi:hypothetical protein
LPSHPTILYYILYYIILYYIIRWYGGWKMWYFDRLYIFIYIKSFYFVVKDMHCYRHWNQGMMMWKRNLNVFEVWIVKIGKKEATPPTMMHGFDLIRGPKILLGTLQLASAARCYRSRNDYSISVINYAIIITV